MIEMALKYLGLNTQGKLALMDYYNSKIYPLINIKRKYKIQPNDNWCAMFVSVIAHKTGLAPDKFPYEVSVFFMTKEAKSRGTFSKNIEDANINDLIVYDWKSNGTLDHVGILLEKGNGFIRVIEGNYSNTVKIRKVILPSTEVYGVIKTGVGLDIETLARDVIKGKYGNGDERKTALGENYDAVQKRVKEILKA